MARLRTNIAANIVGQGWVALMGIVFVPVYLAILGREGFGIVGAMIGLQSLSIVLDLGASMFASREVARRRSEPLPGRGPASLVRSFEVFVWMVAALLGVGLALAAPVLAAHWLDGGTLAPATTESSLRWIAAVVALLWPTSFYAAVMQGLERQPRLNAMAAAGATLRFGGAVPVLWATGGDLLAFLAWHAVAGAAQTLAYRLATWRELRRVDPGPAPARWDEIGAARAFAFGAFATVGLSMLLTQVDRFVLSSLRPLAEFGDYTVALTVSAGLARLLQPVFWAIYPRMSLLLARGDDAGLRELYHGATQGVSVLAAGLGATLAFHAEPLLAWWTGDAALAARMARPLALLVAGATINGVLLLPYALQLAHGVTRLSAWANLIALTVGIPYCLHATATAGAVGAATLWPAVNLGMLLLLAPLTHRLALPGITARWFVFDVLAPAAAAVAVAAAFAALHPNLPDGLLAVAWLGLVWAAATLGGLALAPRVRAGFRGVPRVSAG